MRARKIVGTVGIACVFGLIGGVVVANAGANITSPETIRVLGTTTKERFADVGKPDFSPGDTIMFVERLTDEETDAVVGKLRVECTVHISEWAFCRGAFSIDGRGEIVGEGTVSFAEDGPSAFVIPITGGTGEFANVRGEDHIAEISEDEEVHELDLLP